MRYLYENSLLVSFNPFDNLPHSDDNNIYTLEAEAFLLEYQSDHDTLLAARDLIERWIAIVMANWYLNLLMSW